MADLWLRVRCGFLYNLNRSRHLESICQELSGVLPLQVTLHTTQCKYSRGTGYEQTRQQTARKVRRLYAHSAQELYNVSGSGRYHKLVLQVVQGVGTCWRIVCQCGNCRVGTVQDGGLRRKQHRYAKRLHPFGRVVG